MHRTAAWLVDGRVRLALLLTLLAALVAYVLATRTGALGTAPGTADVDASAAADCPVWAAPPVENVSRATLQGLREDLRGVMFDRDRRLYEQGLISSSNAWSDDEPGTHLSLPPSPIDPGAYELRWWAANGDDVVTDVFVFAGASRARDFFELASSARCRQLGAAFAASSPPGGRDLVWRNPDRFAQEDVYLLRGQRVYRVSVVRAGAGSGVTPAGRRAAFALVNGLACALPGAACRPRSDQALAQQTLAEQLTLLRRELPGSEPGYSGARGESAGACANASGAHAGETGSALSESLSYDGDLGLRVGIHIYDSDTAARRALARYATRAALSCLARSLASAARERRAHAGQPRYRLTAAPIGQGAFVVEVELPLRYGGRSYAWALDGVVLRRGRTIDDLTTLAAATNVRFDERLAARLAQSTAGTQG
jgi:hypothetical protein